MGQSVLCSPAPHGCQHRPQHCGLSLQVPLSWPSLLYGFISKEADDGILWHS